VGKTNILENAQINWLRGASPTPPAALYAGLYTTMPSDGEAGTGGVEVSGGSYARVLFSFNAPSNGNTSNAAQIDYPTPTADWGDVVGFGVWDAISGGNLLLISTPFATAKTIQVGDPVSFAAGALQYQED
jgi:hypothetical protein